MLCNFELGPKDPCFACGGLIELFWFCIEIKAVSFYCFCRKFGKNWFPLLISPILELLIGAFAIVSKMLVEFVF